MIRERRRPPPGAAGAAALLLAVGLLLVSSLFASAGAATGSQSPASGGGQGVGLTVSWTPVSSPVQAVPGRTAVGHFWVTNQTSEPVPVTVAPATAVPGDNGGLRVRSGADPRFSSISYSPDTFTAEPKETSEVTVSAAVPRSLGPGVYLVPAVVEPHPRPGDGTIRLQESIVGLVTYQIPGATDARVQPSFVGAEHRAGVAPVMHVPGLPPVMLATSGSQVLRVLNDSKASFFAYNEITATSSLGQAVLGGHAPGDPGDLRGTPELYFPGRYLTFPVSWHTSALGLGTTTLHAYVRYQPRPGVLVTSTTSTSVLVISPLWILVVVGMFGVLLLAAWIRRRRQVTVRAHPTARPAATSSRRIIRSVTSGLIIVIVAGLAYLSQPLVFVAIGVVGILVACGGVVALRSRRRPKLARAVGFGQIGTAALLLATVALTVLAALSRVPAQVAVGVLAGTGVWLLLGWWVLWWNEGRPDPADGTAPNDKPGGTGTDVHRPLERTTVP